MPWHWAVSVARFWYQNTHTNRNTHTQSPDQSTAICLEPDDEYESWQTIRQLISSTLNAVCFFSVCGLCVYLHVCLRRKVSAHPSVCASTVVNSWQSNFSHFRQILKNGPNLTTAMQAAVLIPEDVYISAVTSTWLLLVRKKTFAYCCQSLSIAKCRDYCRNPIKQAQRKYQHKMWVHCWDFWTEHFDSVSAWQLSSASAMICLDSCSLQSQKPATAFSFFFFYSDLPLRIASGTDLWVNVYFNPPPQLIK